MKLYLCNYPIQFPASEYGGMVAVVAADDEQFKKIIFDAYGSKEAWDNDMFSMELALRDFAVLDLADGDTPPGIVRSFAT